MRPGEAGTNQSVHFRAVRVVLGEETFFEKQELVFGSGRVVDDGDEVHDDGLLQGGVWVGFEIRIGEEGEFG